MTSTKRQPSAPDVLLPESATVVAPLNDSESTFTRSSCPLHSSSDASRSLCTCPTSVVVAGRRSENSSSLPSLSDFLRNRAPSAARHKRTWDATCCLSQLLLLCRASDQARTGCSLPCGSNVYTCVPQPPMKASGSNISQSLRRAR